MGVVTSLQRPADILPVRASPEIWHGPRGHVDLIGFGNDPSVYNFCSFPLKLFTETAETDSSNIFHRRCHRPTLPVGRVLSNFRDHGDRVHLVPSNFCDWLPFIAVHCEKLTVLPQTCQLN